ETELLVETVSEKIKNITDCSVLDIGTGSGNIIISLAHETGDSNYIGIDIDENIVAVARENAALHELADKIRFLTGDIFDPELSLLLHRKFDVIASNPPYIPESDFAELPAEIREFEPHSALAGGDDGLKYYRRIAEISPDLLEKNGFLALELGMGQADAVEKILRQSGFADIEVIKDLNGIDRVVISRSNN
ncbi:HemK family protein methyltransferase, partial [candidate division KSB1 bacterium]|nr:HemK family protein methyltransferase [candidate division KSB1 bacterium]